MNFRPALTLIELVIVIGLISVLAVPSIIGFTNFRGRYALKASGENLANTLRTTRVYAREERHEVAWGLRYTDESSYAMISGSPESFVVVRTYDLEKPVIFVDSFSDIWFGQSNGETDRNYRIDLAAPNGAEARVEISKEGVVRYEEE